VFVAGGVPTHTLVQREVGSLQRDLSSAAQTRHRLILVRGISKIGKSVLARSVAIDPIVVACGANDDEEALWRSLASGLSAFSSETFEFQANTETQVKGSASAKFSGVGASGELSLRGGSQGKVQKQRSRDLSSEVLQLLTDEDRTLIFEDAHRLSHDGLTRVLSALREPLMQGLRVIFTSTRLSLADIFLAQPDFLGRVARFDVDPWMPEELTRIVVEGFDTLGLSLPADDIAQIVASSEGSPFLTQLICLEYCHRIGYRRGVDARMAIPSQDLTSICRKIAQEHALPLGEVLRRTMLRPEDAESVLTRLAEHVAQGGAYGAMPLGPETPIAPTDDEASQFRAGALVPYGLEEDQQAGMLHVLDPMILFGLRWGM